MLRSLHVKQSAINISMIDSYVKQFGSFSVVVSEGVEEEDGKFSEQGLRDSFGHAQPGCRACGGEHGQGGFGRQISLLMSSGLSELSASHRPSYCVENRCGNNDVQGFISKDDFDITDKCECILPAMNSSSVSTDRMSNKRN